MEERRVIRVGSRESKLAVAQTMILIRELEAAHPELSFELVTMKTTGDQILDKPLDQIGGKGLFVRELDRALEDGTVELTVHSLKDMPMEQPDGYPIVAYAERGEPRDVLVWRNGEPEQGRKLRIGTSSARRRLQLQKRYPNAEFLLLRGNVLTRLRKLDEGQYDGIVLAAAGLIRLGLGDRISEYLEPEEMIPAAGQGILAVQGRDGEDYTYLDCIRDPEAEACALAERSFVRTLDGGCSSPIAAYARCHGDRLTLRGLYYEEAQQEESKEADKTKGENRTAETGTICGLICEAERLGIRLANRLRNHVPKNAKVWLVGAGPSDPGLFTLKGKAVLEQAQVVVYDRLVGAGILAMIPAAAERIFVGKEAGHHPVPQEKINQILCEKAMEGKRVVRLKGGDPFMFGRGGEELERLEAMGIPFEVVPGVTAASAVTAYAGIPVTHRDYGSSVHLITAHKKRGCEELPDFETLAKLSGTLVFYMGLGALGDICRGLIRAGMDPGTPAAVIEQGTTAAQQSVTADLETLEAETKQAGLNTPALIVVGAVCALSKQFFWAEERPLSGKRIFVTRPKKRSSRLIDRLEALGAEVVPLPAIETVPIKSSPEITEMAEHLEGASWIAFTSAEGVDCFFDRLLELGRDIRSLGAVKFAVIGPATARVLRTHGILADLQPETYTGEALGKALADAMKPGERLLIPRAGIGTETLLKPLDEAEILYETIALYDTITAAGAVNAPGAGDLVTFTSASTVRGFAAQFPELDMKTITGLCIGEQTRNEAEKLGIRTMVSEQATIDSMTETLKKGTEEGRWIW